MKINLTDTPHHSLLIDDPTTGEKPALSPHSEMSIRPLRTWTGIPVTLVELGNNRSEFSAFRVPYKDKKNFNYKIRGAVK